MNKKETGMRYPIENEPTADELRLIAAVFRSDNEWSSQPRAVYTGESMEKELDELFPVEVGVQAIKDKQAREAQEREQNIGNEADK